MQINDNLIARLTISLEGFAYTLPVLVLVYFAVIGGNFFSILNLFIPAALFASVVTLVGGSMTRWARLRPAFNALNSPGELDVKNLHDIKLRLLFHPRYEALSMLVRYPVWVGMALAIVAIAGELTTVRFVVTTAGMIMIIPITGLFFMFQSEISLSRYLADSRLTNIIVTKESYK